MIVALVTDFFFASKICGTAAMVEAEVVIVRTPADALAALAPDTHLLVDANNAGGDAAETIRAAKRRQPTARVTTYLAHIQVDLADDLREAGADAVLPRSKFTEDLVAILKGKAV